MSVQFVYTIIIVVVSISFVLGFILNRFHIAAVDEVIKEFTKTLNLKKINEAVAKVEAQNANNVINSNVEIEILDENSSSSIFNDSANTKNYDTPIVISSIPVIINSVSVEDANKRNI